MDNRDLMKLSLSTLFTPTKHTGSLESAYEHEPYFKMFVDTVEKNDYLEVVQRLVKLAKQAGVPPPPRSTEYSMPIIHFYVEELELPENYSSAEAYTNAWMYIFEDYLRPGRTVDDNIIKDIANYKNIQLSKNGVTSHSFLLKKAIRMDLYNDSKQLKPKPYLSSEQLKGRSVFIPMASRRKILEQANNKHKKAAEEEPARIEATNVVANAAVPEPVSNNSMSTFEVGDNVEFLTKTTSSRFLPGKVTRVFKGKNDEQRYMIKSNNRPDPYNVSYTQVRSPQEEEIVGFGRRRRRSGSTKYKLAWIPKTSVRAGMIVHPTIKRGARYLTAVPL